MELRIKKLFKRIKKEFTKELILKIYLLILLIKVKIDILDFILGAYLLQKHINKVQYLVVYYNKKLILLELNYDIYNKELLAIIAAFKEQRLFL